MTAKEFIIKHIEKQGWTQAKAAEVVGLSRQNLWDKLNNRTPRFKTIMYLLDAYGFQVNVVREDGKPIEFNEADFFVAAEKIDIYYDSLEEVMRSMGYVMKISEKVEK